VTKSDVNSLDTHTWTSTISPTSGDPYFTIDSSSKSGILWCIQTCIFTTQGWRTIFTVFFFRCVSITLG
jgi:hypothetical protein